MTQSGQTSLEKGSAVAGQMQASLEQKMGYSFKDKNLLATALTHSSAVSDRQKSNERLEFLGDRVLGLIIADMLLVEFPNEDEGALGYRFAALARRESLERVAEFLLLEPHIKREVDPSEMSSRQRSGLLANACEAIIAAIYLDGGIVHASAFIKHHWMDLLKEDVQPPKDAKTQLQEYVQSRGWSLPTYQIVNQSGPDHAPEFTIEVTIENHLPAQGSGQSKRSAETAAAQILFLQLTGNSNHE